MPVDIVIVRHPNESSREWKQIFQSCYNITKNDGIIITTHYMPQEQTITQLYLQSAGFKVEIKDENPNSRIFSNNGLFPTKISLPINEFW